jgi:zinc transport system substrate-binding protein
MRRLLGLWVAGLLTGLLGCAAAPELWSESPTLKVLTSFAPLYCFTANVAGPDAQVQCLLTGKGPHNYTGTVQDALRLREADLFITNGLSLDDAFVTKLHKNAGNRALRLVRVGERLPADLLLAGGECHHDHDDPAHAHPHKHGPHDPHVWLGIPEAVRIVEIIRDELKAADPAHAEGYSQRAAEYIARLNRLHQEGKALLADKTERKLISMHGAFAYFARAFDLTIPETIQLDAGVEPTGNRLADLITLATKEKIRVIATEPQYSASRSAQKLLDSLKAAGLEAVSVEIDPLETVSPDALTAELYEQKMRQNLANLASVLK